MKITSVAFKSRLGDEASNIALCVRIVRRDGTQFGFSTWDQEFDFEFVNNTDAHGAITYYPHGAFSPSDSSSSSTLSVDNMEIAGVLSSESLSSSELSIGLFEEAEVTFFRLDPENLSEGEMIDKRGYIGQITLTEDTYKAELLSVAAFYKRNVGTISSPTCTVKRFCNEQCKLVEGDFTFAATVYGTVLPRDTVLDLTITGTLPANDKWTNGLVRVTYLGNSFEREIREVVNSVSGRKTITLKEPFGFALTGLTGSIIQGCDRAIASCIAFGNAINFRGMPHLPGSTQLVQIGRAPE